MRSLPLKCLLTIAIRRSNDYNETVILCRKGRFQDGLHIRFGGIRKVGHFSQAGSAAFS